MDLERQVEALKNLNSVIVTIFHRIMGRYSCPLFYEKNNCNYDFWYITNKYRLEIFEKKDCYYAELIDTKKPKPETIIAGNYNSYYHLFSSLHNAILNHIFLID